MAAYLLIESRDPYESTDVNHFLWLAAALARRRHNVTLFLVQNAVLGLRAGAEAGAFAELRSAGIEVLADSFSLRERGIGEERLTPAVASADLGVVIQRLAEGHITLWH